MHDIVSLVGGSTPMPNGSLMRIDIVLVVGRGHNLSVVIPRPIPWYWIRFGPFLSLQSTAQAGCSAREKHRASAGALDEIVQRKVMQ
jgi:hypothetical protein